MAKFSMSRFFGVDDDYEDEPEALQETQSQAINASSKPVHRDSNKVVALNAPRPTMNKISLYEPRLYADVQEIASHLLSQQAVIVNFARIDDPTARRIVDFLTGTVFAIDGDIERIGDGIFLCTPKNFEISGDLSASLNDKLK